MPNKPDRLKFPTDRPVAAARADAKKRSRSLSISLHVALDDTAKKNGKNNGFECAADLSNNR